MYSDSPMLGRPRTILFHASRDALGPLTDVILAKLGYPIVLPDVFEVMRAKDPDLRPDMLLVTSDVWARRRATRRMVTARFRSCS